MQKSLISRLSLAGFAAALAIVVLISVAPARASVPVVIFVTPTLQAAQGSSGSFDVLFSNNTGADADLAGESVELHISGSGVLFTDTSAATTAAPYVFPQSFDADLSSPLDLSGIPYPKNDFITSDLSDSSTGFVVISSAETVGLVNVSYTVDPGATLGDRTLSFVADGTSTSDIGGNSIPFITSGGVLTVVGVPEPVSVAMLVLGGGLIMRRRRRF